MIRSSIRSIYHMHFLWDPPKNPVIALTGLNCFVGRNSVTSPHSNASYTSSREPILVKYDLELIHVKNHLTDNIKYHFLLLFLCLDRGKYNGFQDNLF